MSAPMQVHPIPHAIFETTRPGFIQILHHCSMSWKITPLYFLTQTSYTSDKNSPSKWNVGTFEWLSENSQNSSWHGLIWNYKSVFLKNSNHSAVSWEITLPYFFSWNFILFWWKKPMKVPNFRLLISPNF